MKKIKLTKKQLREIVEAYAEIMIEDPDKISQFLDDPNTIKKLKAEIEMLNKLQEELEGIEFESTVKKFKKIGIHSN